MTPISYSVRALTGLALAAIAIAAPAQAKKADKPVEVTITDKTFPETASRMCMPRTVIDKSRKSDLPKTLCHTREEWEAKGVTFKTNS
jgi:hypothetical protein